MDQGAVLSRIMADEPAALGATAGTSGSTLGSALGLTMATGARHIDNYHTVDILCQAGWVIAMAANKHHHRAAITFGFATPPPDLPISCTFTYSDASSLTKAVLQFIREGRE